MPAGVALCVVALVMTGIATLRPELGVARPRDLDLADRLANIILFMPFGFGLALLRVSALRALALGLLVSGCIELIQQHLPGRVASLYDVGTNGFGALVGCVVGRWLVARPTAWGAHLALAATAFVLLAQGWLAQPVLLPGPHAIQWHPATGTGARWKGTLNRILVDRTPVWIGMTDTARLARVVSGGTLTLELAQGATQREPVPLFLWRAGNGDHALTIYMEDNDLRVRVADRGTVVGLPHPPFHWVDALSGAMPGEPMNITLQLRQDGACLTLDPFTARCGLGPPPSRGWARVRLPQGAGPEHLALLDFLWCLGWGLLLTWWAPSARWTLGAAAALTGFTVMLTAETALGPPRALDLVAFGLGGTLGYLRARWYRRALARSAEHTASSRRAGEAGA